jgi:hypothetical protein
MVLPEQPRIRAELEQLAKRMADMARQQSTDPQIALAWLERADLLTRLADSIPTDDPHVKRWGWVLTRREDVRRD